MARYETPRKLRNEIERWLDAHVGQLAEHQGSGFTSWRSCCDGPLFVYGAGGLGRKLVGGLHAEGVLVDGFCDSNPQLWGSESLGLPIISPEEAILKAGATGGFVIATWSLGCETSNAVIRRELEARGARHWTFFTTAFWQYPERFLPHYRIDLPSKLLAARPAILSAADVLTDEQSRREFFVQLKMLVTTTFDEISYSWPGETYFPDDLVVPSMLRRFVDCGAFDGDTLKKLLQHAGNFLEHYWGFEPDPKNFQRLCDRVAAGLKTAACADVFPYAVGSRAEKLRFEATGGVDARLTASGNVEVECRRLDDLLVTSRPSFVKMDIEGAEIEALAGAHRVLTFHQPACAVCVYHRQDHLWNVPLRLHADLPRHGIHLRAHRSSYDIVCYALPTMAASAD
ncbi:MAG: FkbM family methyltransferase [Planctomycetota bacterium]|nr:FkbM family methyltransferase [Planctomycetota bacterium]